MATDWVYFVICEIRVRGFIKFAQRALGSRDGKGLFL